MATLLAAGVFCYAYLQGSARDEVLTQAQVMMEAAAAMRRPAAAPPAMLIQYGSMNGFGWKLGEIVGAQIVSVPATVSS
jgi:hypothetical protein